MRVGMSGIEFQRLLETGNGFICFAFVEIILSRVGQANEIIAGENLAELERVKEQSQPEHDHRATKNENASGREFRRQCCHLTHIATKRWQPSIGERGFGDKAGQNLGTYYERLELGKR